MSSKKNLLKNTDIFLDKEFRKDLKLSLVITSHVISAVMLIVIVLSIFYPKLFIELSPVCLSKSLHNSECFMCGTSRAFVEISNGKFFEAFALNKLSPLIYLIFLISGVYLISVMVTSLRKKVFSNTFQTNKSFNNFIKLK